jgi:hypothetical protein
MVASRPKVSFRPDGSTNPGNYGWLFIELQQKRWMLFYSEQLWMPLHRRPRWKLNVVIKQSKSSVDGGCVVMVYLMEINDHTDQCFNGLSVSHISDHEAFSSCAPLLGPSAVQMLGFPDNCICCHIITRVKAPCPENVVYLFYKMHF